MVSAFHHQNVLSPRAGPSHPKGQLVGLASRANEIDHGEGFGQGGHQALGIVRQEVMEVACVGVQQGHLSLAGLHHTRMAVPHMGDVVYAVEVCLALIVEEELARTPHDLEGLLVRDAQGGAQVLPPGFEKFSLEWRRLLTRGIQKDARSRLGPERKPGSDLPARWISPGQGLAG